MDIKNCLGLMAYSKAEVRLPGFCSLVALIVMFCSVQVMIGSKYMVDAAPKARLEGWRLRESRLERTGRSDLSHNCRKLED